eukprot:TRINITY_DN52543_c0_g1_i1.p1 TRINITY_DN52543_c0_g1~~TRINITY_DN52543_c0_g1_i1.p1  ORF type:complete len:228 (+),score=55.74 TRINITY_DN52543_c0_g1_i1:76-684(+)
MARKCAILVALFSLSSQAVALECEGEQCDAYDELGLLQGRKTQAEELAILEQFADMNATEEEMNKEFSGSCEEACDAKHGDSVEGCEGTTNSFTQTVCGYSAARHNDCAADMTQFLAPDVTIRMNVPLNKHKWTGHDSVENYVKRFRACGKEKDQKVTDDSKPGVVYVSFRAKKGFRWYGLKAKYTKQEEGDLIQSISVYMR